MSDYQINKMSGGGRENKENKKSLGIGFML
jgi:hypothetical protein